MLLYNEMACRGAGITFLAWLNEGRNLSVPALRSNSHGIVCSWAQMSLQPKVALGGFWHVREPAHCNDERISGEFAVVAVFVQLDFLCCQRAFEVTAYHCSCGNS
jgi:hypothetical protein